MPRRRDARARFVRHGAFRACAECAADSANRCCARERGSAGGHRQRRFGRSPPSGRKRRASRPDASLAFVPHRSSPGRPRCEAICARASHASRRDEQRASVRPERRGDVGGQGSELASSPRIRRDRRPAPACRDSGDRALLERRPVNRSQRSGFRSRYSSVPQPLLIGFQRPSLLDRSSMENG